jgi:GNAT superfamily N-acetyltransferase
VAWTFEQRRDAVIEAPLVDSVGRVDTRVIARDGWYQVITPSAPGTLHNEVLFSQVEPADAERTIDEVVAMYAATGHPTKWCVGPWTRPADFGDRLAHRGFSSWETRGMGCETTLEVTGGEVRVDEVVTEEALDAYTAVALAGWAIPETELEAERLAFRGAYTRTPRIVHFFVACFDDAIVGTAAIVMRVLESRSYGYLVGSQVLERARGHGVYKALVGARLRFLRERGIDLAVTHAREATSAPILEHLGFETLFRGRCHVGVPSKSH